MAGIVDKILETALQLLEEHPDGLRYTELNKKIIERATQISITTQLEQPHGTWMLKNLTKFTSLIEESSNC